MDVELIPKDEWEWFGTAGHFICGRYCRFHLCTKVGPYLVSTLGAYVHPRHSAGSEVTENIWLAAHYPGEDIGYGRKYETMVFVAGPPCDSVDCGCGQPSIDGDELEAESYNVAGEALRGHMRMCARYAGHTQEAAADSPIRAFRKVTIRP